MKKLFLFTIIGIFLTSCQDKDNFLYFEKDEYSIHYDESVLLNVLSSSNQSSHNFTVTDPNIIEINSSGLVSGLSVGTSYVEVTGADKLSDRCKVVVVPYETLYIAPLIPLNTLTPNVIKTIEIRDLERETANTLTYRPLESESQTDSLRYTFQNNVVHSLEVFFPDNIDIHKIYLFLAERYSVKGRHACYDVNTKANVSFHLKTGDTHNRIEYSY